MKIFSKIRLNSALRKRLALQLVLFMLLVRPVQAMQINGDSLFSAVSGQTIVGAKEAVRRDEARQPTTGIEIPPTAQDVLLDVCEEAGYGEDCARVLLGMMWKESKNVATAVGDQGRARGYFQIWVKLHNISISCAEDLRCSAGWTLRRLERFGYPRYVNYAVQCHNGCGIQNGYASSAIWNGKRLWSTPLELADQVASR